MTQQCPPAPNSYSSWGLLHHPHPGRIDDCHPVIRHRTQQLPWPPASLRVPQATLFSTYPHPHAPSSGRSLWYTPPYLVRCALVWHNSHACALHSTLHTYTVPVSSCPWRALTTPQALCRTAVSCSVCIFHEARRRVARVGAAGSCRRVCAWFCSA